MLLLPLTLTDSQESGDLKLGISDHGLIYTIGNQKLPKPKSKRIELRTMKTFNETAFLSDLKNILWGALMCLMMWMISVAISITFLNR